MAKKYDAENLKRLAGIKADDFPRDDGVDLTWLIRRVEDLMKEADFWKDECHEAQLKTRNLELAFGKTFESRLAKLESGVSK